MIYSLCKRGVKSRNKETKQMKITVLKSVSLLYDRLIDIYKKEYYQVFESKDEDWRERHDYKNLKDLEYQADKTDEEEKDETDQELPAWIKSKDEFNELKNYILSIEDNLLKTGTKNINMILGM